MSLRVILMSIENNDKKVKSIKKMKYLVGSLLGVFVFILIVFGVLVMLPTAETSTVEDPLSREVLMTSRTEIIALEKCTHCPQQVENTDLVEMIKLRQFTKLQDLRAYLITHLDLDTDEDPIKEFTRDRVVIQYQTEKCSKCLDNESVFMVYEKEHLVFYQGAPTNENILKKIPEEVVFLDKDKELTYIQGVKMEEQIFYVGIYKSSFGVYENQPIDDRPPLLIFPNISVGSDLLHILIEEKPSFNTYDQLLQLIEAYSGHN